tara:strand:- start:138 stop:320 length:183 start_codon:yes stop_codon:yes gene_type:complete
MLFQKLQQTTLSLQELPFSKRPDLGRCCASAGAEAKYSRPMGYRQLRALNFIIHATVEQF